MCEFCEKGKEIRNDNNIKSFISKAHFGYSIIVQTNKLYLDVQNIGFINYCPMCRKEAGRVIEVIKNILFIITLIIGNLCLIMLLLCALYRCFCIFLDHMKNANVLRKCMMIYIKRKRPDIKLELEQIDIKRQGIHLKKEDKQ